MNKLVADLLKSRFQAQHHSLMAIYNIGFDQQEEWSLLDPAISGLGQRLKGDFDWPWHFDI